MAEGKQETKDLNTDQPIRPGIEFDHAESVGGM